MGRGKLAREIDAFTICSELLWLGLAPPHLYPTASIESFNLYSLICRDQVYPVLIRFTLVKGSFTE